MSEINPLLEDFDDSIPGITVTLPTRGIFYDEGMFEEGSDPDELEVRPFSMWEEVHHRNPFAIMSGKASRQMVNTVAPSITRPDDLTVYDMEMLMLGGRMASYGNDMEITVECSNPELLALDDSGFVIKDEEKAKDVIKKRCQHKNKIKVDLKNAMQSYHIFDDKDLEEWQVELPNGQLVHLRPLMYKDVLETLKIGVEQQRLTDAAAKIEQLTEEQQEEISDATLKNFMNIKIVTLVSSIWYVETKDKSRKIRDREMIKEWIESDKFPNSYVEKIYNKVQDLMERYSISSNLGFQCENCGYENTNISVVQDPSRFFTES